MRESDRVEDSRILSHHLSQRIDGGKMKSIILGLVIGLSMILSVNAEYSTYKDSKYYCENATMSEWFMADCPADYRVENDWFSYYHFENQSLAYCNQNKELVINCSYEIKKWNHPNVQGSAAPSRIQTESTTLLIPEFSTITAAFALVGSALIYFRRRK